jgi:glycine/D-amino acid oxidase-like deaminating enzyme
VDSQPNMNTRTAHRNLWQSTCRELVPTSVHEGKRSVDLVIIGGGFTGCSAALVAAELGVKVCLLEAETIGQGGSGRNVGLVNAGLWIPPDRVEELLGKKDGERLNNALANGPGLVFSRIEKHEINCEPVRNGTLHCAESASGWRDLQERHRQQRKRGAPVRLLDAVQTKQHTGSDTFQGALHDARAGTIQPLAYCLGLARAAQQAGAHIHTNSAVTRIMRRRNSWQVHTARGVVSAKAMLVATNAYHLGVDGLPPPAIIPMHYFQMATAPLDAAVCSSVLPNLEGCWDTATVMSSFRRDEEGRLIIGSFGSLDHSGSSVHQGWARRMLTRMFPQLHGARLEQAWCGRIAMTSDHLPKIVRLGPNALMAFGYSGRGISPGTVFGSCIAAALISGDESLLPVRPVAAHREAFAAPKAAFYETGAFLTHLVRR